MSQPPRRRRLSEIDHQAPARPHRRAAESCQRVRRPGPTSLLLQGHSCAYRGRGRRKIGRRLRCRETNPMPQLNDPQRYLDPIALAKVRNLEIAGPPDRRGLSLRDAQKPLPRLLRRVRPAPRVRARRRPQAPRLEGLQPHRPLLPQAVRGGDEPRRLAAAWTPASRCATAPARRGPTAGRSSPSTTTPRCGRRPRLPRAAPAGLGRPRDVRRPGAPGSSSRPASRR